MSNLRDSQQPFGCMDFLSWDHEWNHRHNGDDALRRSVDALKELGVSFVRFDFLWSDIEPAKGSFNFEKYDHVVDLLAKAEIKVLGLLAYSPTWNGQEWRQAPNPSLYSRYARSVVKRYKARIKHWEIWNEPDHFTFWQPQDQMRSYVDLLRQAYVAIKAEDATSIVHLAGLSRALPGCLTQIYDLGAQDAFDVVNIHAFANPLRPHALEGLRSLYGEIRRVMKSYDDADKDVWLTQISCPGMKKTAAAPPWWLGPNLTEEQQAVWLEKAFQEVLQWPHVGKVFWSFLRDTDQHFNSGVDFFGLLRQDFSKKPAFFAYQQLIARWKKLTVKSA